MTQTRTINVWDPVVRIGHWLLVVAFFTAYFTEDDFLTQHTWAGYIVAAIVFIRIIWGFIGTRYARFSQFIYRPSTIIQYLAGLFQHKPQHYIGHNPAGGAMVIALLLSLSVTVVSGMKLYAVEENKGPFSTAAPFIIKQAQASASGASNHMVNEADEEFWEEVHEIATNLTLLLVFLHISGIIMSSIVDKEKLLKAMFTGKKEVDDRFQ